MRRAAVTVAMQRPPLFIPSATSPEGVTYSNQIARIVQQHCQACHRPDDIAPFPLLTWEDAYRQRQKILRHVETRKMPPWKPVPGFGDFLDSRRLPDADIAAIRAWVQAGAPEGDPRDLPLPRRFPETWSLGAPDLVLAAETYEVPSAKSDLYRCFVIPTDFTEDRYLSAVEFVPGNRKIVHHVLTYMDTSGQAEALDRADPGPGYTCFGGPGFLPTSMGIGGWAPGILSCSEQATRCGSTLTGGEFKPRLRVIHCSGATYAGDTRRCRCAASALARGASVPCRS